MIYQKKTINNVPTKVPLSNSAPVGNPIGTIISTYKKIQPRNYLYCDGSTFDENVYPALYLYLGTNVLPDYRECAMVGAEKNTTDVFDSTQTNPSTGLPGTQNHDIYAQGEFKDDSFQGHIHFSEKSSDKSADNASTIRYQDITGSTTNMTDAIRRSYYSDSQHGIPRVGTVTRGKRKAVYYYIKAVDGVDISDEDTFLNTVKDYVDEKNSFSTDEVRTGGTWIDGKPIYRRSFTVSGIGTETWTNVTNASWINSVARIIDCEVSTNAVSDYGGHPKARITNGYLQSWDLAGYNAGVMTLEYTKTTD